MNPLQRRLRVLVTAAAVGLTAWKCLPMIPDYEEFDRAVFETAARSFSNPPFFVSGHGSHEQPWTLRMLSAESRVSDVEAVPVISIADDSIAYFQSSPLSAVDYAVILRNLKRLGVSRVALSAVMAWDELDPASLTAVDARLADFDSAVTAAPLTRGAVPEALPLPFYRASLPISRVKGDIGALPQVNRLALPGTFLGSGKTLAGFSILESEQGEGPPPVVARWKDRIVFSFPVIAALAQFGQQPDQIEVRLGSYLKLGPGGPIVPIDANGRLTSWGRHFKGKVIPAQSVIRVPELDLGTTVILRDDRSGADPETKRFSESAVDSFTAITHETGLTPARAFDRLSVSNEPGFVMTLALLLAVGAAGSQFRLKVVFSLIAAFVMITQLTGLVWGALWLPLYPALCTIAAGYVAAWPWNAKTVVPLEIVEPTVVPEPAPSPEVIEVPEAETIVKPAPKPRAARKATGVKAKKTAPEPTEPEISPGPEKAVKKVAKKAAPATKAAKNAAGRTEKPAAKKSPRKAAKKVPKPPESE